MNNNYTQSIARDPPPPPPSCCPRWWRCWTATLLGRRQPRRRWQTRCATAGADTRSPARCGCAPFPLPLPPLGSCCLQGVWGAAQLPTWLLADPTRVPFIVHFTLIGQRSKPDFLSTPGGDPPQEHAHDRAHRLRQDRDRAAPGQNQQRALCQGGLVVGATCAPRLASRSWRVSGAAGVPRRSPLPSVRSKPAIAATRAPCRAPPAGGGHQLPQQVGFHGAPSPPAVAPQCSERCLLRLPPVCPAPAGGGHQVYGGGVPRARRGPNHSRPGGQRHHHDAAGGRRRALRSRQPRQRRRLLPFLLLQPSPSGSGCCGTRGSWHPPRSRPPAWSPSVAKARGSHSSAAPPPTSTAARCPSPPPPAAAPAQGHEARDRRGGGGAHPDGAVRRDRQPGHKKLVPRPLPVGGWAAVRWAGGCGGRVLRAALCTAVAAPPWQHRRSTLQAVIEEGCCAERQSCLDLLLPTPCSCTALTTLLPNQLPSLLPNHLPFPDTYSLHRSGDLDDRQVDIEVPAAAPRIAAPFGGDGSMQVAGGHGGRSVVRKRARRGGGCQRVSHTRSDVAATNGATVGGVPTCAATPIQRGLSHPAYYLAVPPSKLSPHPPPPTGLLCPTPRPTTGDGHPSGQDLWRGPGARGEAEDEGAAAGGGHWRWGRCECALVVLCVCRGGVRRRQQHTHGSVAQQPDRAGDGCISVTCAATTAAAQRRHLQAASSCRCQPAHEAPHAAAPPPIPSPCLQISEARPLIEEQEAEKYVNAESVTREAINAVEQDGELAWGAGGGGGVFGCVGVLRTVSDL